MSNTIYVGNISYDMNEEELKDVFAEFGPIDHAKIIQNRFTGRSRGFGFVAFESDSDAQKALDMNGKEVKGRKLFVNVAREKTTQAKSPRDDHGSEES